MKVTLNLKRKPQRRLTAGPRLILDSKGFGRFEFLSRCFGSGGTLYRRWSLLAFYPPGAPFWLWYVSWEPVWRGLGFSFHRVPGYEALVR